MTFKVIALSNPEWENYIEKSYEYDFHHTNCLHKIEVNEGEEAKLLVAEKREDFVAYPLIIKEIPQTNYYDATSVYGYSGPVSSKPMQTLPENLLYFFKEEFIAYANQKKVIAVFSRLHPLIENKAFFKDFGKVIDLNKTVAIDITLHPDEQRRDYRKSNKSEINQLKKKKGYSVKKIESSDQKSVQEFVAIYTETMQRVNANEYYFFDLDYFDALLHNKCFECNLLVAYQGDQMAAGAIFTISKTIMQYHLAGTKEEFIRDTPMKLILDEARLLANEKGLKFLHLGGGVGGSDDDSLFRFKSGFSKNLFQFSVWNLIVNQEIYQNLVAAKGLKSSDHPNFFPLYRAK